MMKLSDILKNRTKDNIINLANILNKEEYVDFTEIYSNLFLDIKPNPKNNYLSDAKIIIMYIRYHYFLSCLNDDLRNFYKQKFRDMIYDECEDDTFDVGKYVVDMKDGSPNIYDKTNDRVVPKLFIMLYQNIGDEIQIRSLKNEEDIQKLIDKIASFSDKDEFIQNFNQINDEIKKDKDQRIDFLKKIKNQQFRINVLGICVGVIIITYIIQIIKSYLS